MGAGLVPSKAGVQPANPELGGGTPKPGVARLRRAGLHGSDGHREEGGTT
jgi:hypothetical protein